MLRIPTLVSLCVLAVSTVVVSSPCVTFDASFNLLVFGLALRFFSVEILRVVLFSLLHSLASGIRYILYFASWKLYLIKLSIYIGHFRSTDQMTDPPGIVSQWQVKVLASAALSRRGGVPC